MNNKITSWNDRFALIDAHKPSTASICEAFGVTTREFEVAQKLRSAGTFSPTLDLDVEAFSDFFPDVDAEIESAVTTTTAMAALTTKKQPTIHSNKPPETATKKVVLKTPQKRGRKGNKITQALRAVTTTPVLISDFIKEHGVSVAVLRQSKRFIETLPVEEQSGFTRINVKQDRTTKELMIWCDPIINTDNTTEE